MKPIILTEQVQNTMRGWFLDKFNKELEDYRFNMNDTKLEFSFDMSVEAKEKVTIIYSQAAYLRMRALVNYYDTEVGWYGLVDRLGDKLFYVYDVKICKQYVSGSKVDTDDNDTSEFFDSLSDDEIEHMHFQAHSHVKFSTSPSSVDLQNQADVVRNIGKHGFYIFQIWNKFDDINTFMYDLDRNVFYDRKDIVLEIEDPQAGTISDFIADTEELVVEKKYTGSSSASSAYEQDEKKTENGVGKSYQREPAYLPGARAARNDWEDFWE